MSVDREQFNRTVPSHEEVEQHIQRAQQLRSEAIASIAQRLAATISAGARRLCAVIRGALHGHGKKAGGAACFD